MKQQLIGGLLAVGFGLSLLAFGTIGGTYATKETELSKQQESMIEEIKHRLVLYHTAPLSAKGGALIEQKGEFYVYEFSDEAQCKKVYQAWQKEGYLVSYDGVIPLTEEAFVCSGDAGIKEVPETDAEGVCIALLSGGTSAAESAKQALAQTMPKKSRILPISIANAEGETSISALCFAMEEAVEERAQIIALPLSFSGESPLFQHAIELASARGVVIVAPAGVQGENTANVPWANASGVLVVSASDASGDILPQQNFGTQVDISVLGTDCVSRNPSDKVQNAVATARAGGYAAQALDLLDQQAKDIGKPIMEGQETAELVIQMLTQTADDVGDPGYDAVYGYGLVNAQTMERMKAIDWSAHFPEDTIELASGDVTTSVTESPVSFPKRTFTQGSSLLPVSLTKAEKTKTVVESTTKYINSEGTTDTAVTHADTILRSEKKDGVTTQYVHRNYYYALKYAGCHAGTYYLTKDLTVSSTTVLNKAVKIHGQGHTVHLKSTAVGNNGGVANAVFVVEASDVVLHNLVIKANRTQKTESGYCAAVDGIEVRSGCSVKIKSCEIYNARFGIDSYGKTTVEECEIHHCTNTLLRAEEGTLSVSGSNLHHSGAEAAGNGHALKKNEKAAVQAAYHGIDIGTGCTKSYVNACKIHAIASPSGSAATGIHGQGGQIYLGNEAANTISDCATRGIANVSARMSVKRTTVTGCATGIYNEGDLSIENEVIVSAMENGILQAGGFLYLDGGSIRNNTDGVQISKGRVYLRASSLSENETGVRCKGGSLFVSGGEVAYGKNGITMAGGTCEYIGGAIYGQRANGIYSTGGNTSLFGGTIAKDPCGVRVKGGTVSMQGGRIYGCTTGINLAAGTNAFHLDGGTVQDNTTGIYVCGTLIQRGASLTGNGTAVYQAGRYEMRDGACVEANNAVYLAPGAYVTVTGQFAANNTENIATLTSNDFGNASESIGRVMVRVEVSVFPWENAAYAAKLQQSADRTSHVAFHVTGISDLQNQNYVAQVQMAEKATGSSLGYQMIAPKAIVLSAAGDWDGNGQVSVSSTDANYDKDWIDAGDTLADNGKRGDIVLTGIYSLTYRTGNIAELLKQYGLQDSVKIMSGKSPATQSLLWNEATDIETNRTVTLSGHMGDLTEFVGWYDPLYQYVYDSGKTTRMSRGGASTVGGVLDPNYKIVFHGNGNTNDVEEIYTPEVWDTITQYRKDANGNNQVSFSATDKEAVGGFGVRQYTMPGNTGPAQSETAYFEKQYIYTANDRVYYDRDLECYVDYTECYSFQGWSFAKDATIYSDKDMRFASGETFTAMDFLAKAVAYEMEHPKQSPIRYDADLACYVIDLYAVWDRYPTLQTYDRTMHSGEIAEATDVQAWIKERVLEGSGTYPVTADDAEDDTYSDGISTFELPDLEQAANALTNIWDMLGNLDTTGVRDSGSISVRVKVTDGAGNCTMKSVRININSEDANGTTEKKAGALTNNADGFTRFISAEAYAKAEGAGGLNEYSLWKVNPEWNALLEQTFSRLAQFESGAKSVDGGEVWYFSKERVKDFATVDLQMVYADPDAYVHQFYQTYGDCRKTR